MSWSFRRLPFRRPIRPARKSSIPKLIRPFRCSSKERKGVRPNFVLSKENVFDIAQICARLDGLPLAIELAAARIKLLTPSAILQRLENRLQILTSRTDELPERQQTMRGTIAWSFDLLGDQEKKLFKKLAVFAGGFTNRIGGKDLRRGRNE